MTTDHSPVFVNLTTESPIDELCAAAYGAAMRAAKNDLALRHVAPDLASDETTIAYLRAPETRSALEAWIGAYRHDEEIVAAHPDVLGSAWRAYAAVVMQARDAARSA